MKYFLTSGYQKGCGDLIDFAGIIGGFITLFQPTVFVYLLIGFFVGLFFGTVPGLTATLAIALLLPVTFGMEAVPALVMAMGIYMSGIYSGSITATTINIPGQGLRVIR
ncbi:hypothetical protein ES705_45349 [subsurface metagenome]